MQCKVFGFTGFLRHYSVLPYIYVKPTVMSLVKGID